MFEFREFMRQNPSEDNMAFVFPSEYEVEITPGMLTAVSVVRTTSNAGSPDALDEDTFDFFQQFLHELYDGQIGA